MKRLNVHPENPQIHRLKQAIECIQSGGVIAYPTDSCYALGCGLEFPKAIERIRRIRQLSAHHHLTLLCRNVSEASDYAKIEDSSFSLMKRCVPGPFTFILPATRKVPRYLQHEKKGTIGIRICHHAVVEGLLDEYSLPLVSTSLMLPQMDEVLSDPDEMESLLEHQIDVLIEMGMGETEVTTVLDLTKIPTEMVRQGKGFIS